MSQITPLPTPPSTSDPTNFAAEADAFLGALPTFATELNTFGGQLNNLSTSSTSVTSNTIGAGSKAFTVETGKSYRNGMSLTIARTAAPTNRMFAVVDSYDPDTGALVVTSQAFEGSGTFTDWTITLGFNGGGPSTQTVYLPASALLPTITNGANAVYSETTTNKNIISGMAFDAATLEHAQFSIVMPKSWNLGTVAAKFHWKHGATTTNFGVTWALEAVAVGNDDALDVAFGTEQIIADVGGTTNDLYTTASTPALTIAGTPAEGDYVNFQVYRDVADAGDTMAADAVLLGITLLYGTVSNSDA